MLISHLRLGTQVRCLLNMCKLTCVSLGVLSHCASGSSMLQDYRCIAWPSGAWTRTGTWAIAVQYTTPSRGIPKTYFLFQFSECKRAQRRSRQVWCGPANGYKACKLQLTRSCKRYISTAQSLTYGISAWQILFQDDYKYYKPWWRSKTKGELYSGAIFSGNHFW